MEKLNLPTNYSYNLIDLEFSSDCNFKCSLRIAEVRDADSAMTWINVYQSLTHVTWRTARTFNCSGKRLIFRKDFRCQHNTDARRRVKNIKLSKNTDCQATLKIIIHRYYSLEKLKEPGDEIKKFPCVIELYNVHNHALDSAAALRFKDLSPATKEELKRLFHQGHTAASARWSLDTAIQIKDAENYDKLVADASVFPSLSVIQHLFNDEFTSMYGAKRGKDLIDDLKSFCSNYEITSSGKMAIDIINQNIAVAICTPIMQRTSVHLPQAKELILVDASGHMDVLNHRVFFFISPAVVGGAPIGCIITDVEKEDVFRAGVKLLQSCLPAEADIKIAGPKVFMTDGDLKEKNALSSIWPNARYLLCQFHVLKAVWSWLCNFKHGISKSDRQELFFSFKDLMYSKTETEFNQRVALINNMPTVSKYENFHTYFLQLLAKKNLWASCFRSYLPIRGNNTNNYIEVVFKILKDTILNRVKAHSIIQLIDFIVTGYENYLHRRYLDFSYDKYTKSLLKRFLPKSKDVSEMSITFDESKNIFVVKSKDTYFVDARSSFCTCYVGKTGQFCKHIAAVAKNQDLNSTYSYCNLSRELMYKIATGKEVDDDFLKPLRYNPNSRSIDVETHVSVSTVDHNFCVPSTSAASPEPETCHRIQMMKVIFFN